MKPCRRGRAPKKTGICFRTVPAKKGVKKPKKHIVEYHLPSGQLIGFLGKRCVLSYTRKGAASFDRAKEATWTAHACEDYINRPGKPNPDRMDRIYEQAKELPSQYPLPGGS
jgi:hypothetical protein